jgi:hypothetical protein
MTVTCGSTAYVNIERTLPSPSGSGLSLLRIELIMTVLAGFAGGLAGTLWGGLVSAWLLSRQPALRSLGWVPDSGMRVLGTAIAYGASGAAAGFLFWLGWGLAAFIAVPWYVVGAAFGGLLWAAAALPALALLAVRLPALRAACRIVALETGVAALSVGLLCALVWQRAA